MGRIKWTDFRRGLWLVGPAEAVPQSGLRRAKGAAPLRTVALRSRSGTLAFYTTTAHSMTRYNGVYVLGAATDVVRSTNLSPGSLTTVDAGTMDGTRLTFVQMPPTAGKQDSLFIAGGGQLRKLSPDFADFEEWGIAPPDVSSATAVVVAQTSNHADDLDEIGDATAWSESTNTASDYILEDDTTRHIEGDSSMRFRSISKDSSAEADRTGLSLDWTDIGTGAGTSPLEDYVSFAVRVNRPKRIKSISIVFDVVAGGDTFRSKTFSRELKVKVVRKRRKRRLIGTGDIIKRKAEKKFMNDKKDLPRDRSTQEFLSEDTIAVVRRRWTRVTIPKASFEADGGADPDVDWATVSGIRFEVETNKLGSGVNVNFDDLKLVGGVGMQGDYQYNVTYLNSTTGTRSNPDLENTITVKDVERQGVTLASIPFSSDSQVDKVEIWRTLGNGELFFKEQEVDNADVGGGLIDDVDSNVADYIGMFEGTSTVLDPTLELPLDNIKPEDTYEDAVGPHLGRMWWTRDTATGAKGRVYYSPVGRAEATASFIDLASEEDETQKLVIWNEQLYCFTKRKLLRIVGSDEPFLFDDVWGAPGTSQPFSVAVAPEGVVYLAPDGVRLFDGQFSRVLGQDDPLAPLFRNGLPDGFSVTFNGQVATYGRGEYYISDPTDSDRTTLAFDSQTGAWRNIGFPTNFLFYDPKANVLFGQNVPATLGDATIIHAATHTGTITLSAFMKPGGPGDVEATEAAAQALAARDFTITRLTGNLGTALTGGQTADIQFYVNGTLDTGITLSYTSADSTSTAKSATGTVSVSSGDTLSIGVTLGGGAASVVLYSLGYAYDIAPE